MKPLNRNPARRLGIVNAVTKFLVEQAKELGNPVPPTAMRQRLNQVFKDVAAGDSVSVALTEAIERPAVPKASKVKAPPADIATLKKQLKMIKAEKAKLEKMLKKG